MSATQGHLRKKERGGRERGEDRQTDRQTETETQREKDRFDFYPPIKREGHIKTK